jgi:hypothetical protein
MSGKDSILYFLGVGHIVMSSIAVVKQEQNILKITG